MLRLEFLLQHPTNVTRALSQNVTNTPASR